MKKYLLAAACLLLAAGTAEARKTQMHFTPATAPEIRFVGRSATGPEGERSFDWSGTYFTFRFEGRRCAMRASDTKRNYYNVFVDGTLYGKATTELALAFGADDIDGTIDDTTKIYSMAGADDRRPSMSVEEMRRIVRAAGCRAVERDTFYNELPDR